MPAQNENTIFQVYAVYSGETTWNYFKKKYCSVNNFKKKL